MAIQEQINTPSPSPPPVAARSEVEPARAVFDVEGLCCQNEARLIEEKIGDLPGVDRLTVNVPSGTVSVYHTPGRVSPQRIGEAINSLGMTSHLRASDRRATPHESHPYRNPRFVTMALGALFIGLAALARYVLELAPLSVALFVAAIVIGGFYVFRSAWIAARHRRLDITVLMTIAVVGAVAIGEWFEASTVVVLFAFAEWLEGISMMRARHAITDLMELAPPMATVRRDGLEEEVPVEEVAIGDVVVVRPGGKIPVDGTIVAGRTDVDESPITGESVPVVKSAGQEVFAGTITGRGSIEIRTERDASDTVLAHIVDAIEEARANQSPTERTVDRFSQYYTPVVVALAVLVAVLPPLLAGGAWQEWFYRALVLLVIACPCALVISTPIATVVGLARAARQGILIKGGRYLEALGRARAVAFDKTGTLTRGRPQVTEVIAAPGASADEVLQLAATAELRSEHHIGRAILAEARHRGLSLDEGRLRHFEARFGAGVEARLADAPAASSCGSSCGCGDAEQADGEMLRVGTLSWLGSEGVDLAPLLATERDVEARGRTVVGVALDGRLVGLIALADTARPDAAAAIEALRAAGIDEHYVLTGDNLATARQVAAEVGLGADGDRLQASLLPTEKVEWVRQLLGRHGQVVMVGDGVNDAPALAQATVGVAMGAAGTDVALESADVALMADDLTRLPEAIAIGRDTLRVIRQNIVLALAIKAVFLTLAALGLATLWMAIVADMGASLLVIFNALRLLRCDRAPSSATPSVVSRATP